MTNYLITHQTSSSPPPPPKWTLETTKQFSHLVYGRWNQCHDVIDGSSIKDVCNITLNPWLVTYGTQLFSFISKLNSNYGTPLFSFISKHSLNSEHYNKDVCDTTLCTWLVNYGIPVFSFISKRSWNSEHYNKDSLTSLEREEWKQI